MENSMEDVIYFDRFTQEYAKEKDEFAPPERYIEIYKSPGDYYKEVWRAFSHGDAKSIVRLDVAYDEIDKNYAQVIREEAANENDVVLERALSWHVPDSVYQEIFKCCEVD